MKIKNGPGLESLIIIALTLVAVATAIGVASANDGVCHAPQPDAKVLSGVGYVMSYYELEGETSQGFLIASGRIGWRPEHCRAEAFRTDSFPYPPAGRITHLKGGLNDDGNVTAADTAIALFRSPRRM